LHDAEPLNVGVETQPPRNLLGGGDSDGSAAKEGRPSGYTPVSMTPMTTSEAPLDAGSKPDDAERRRNDGVSVVCSSCLLSGTTARTECEDARRAAWRSVRRAAKPVAAWE
jgi:hypothetical protein